MHTASTPPDLVIAHAALKLQRFQQKTSIVSIVALDCSQTCVYFRATTKIQEEVAGHFLPEETPSEAGTNG